MSYLGRIRDYKRQELEALMRKRPLSDVQSRAKDTERPRDFLKALTGAGGRETSIIAEIKKASPSRGIIVEDFDPIQIAETYEEHGAAALSVLTDANFFQGSIRFIHAIKRAVQLPVLRKDFTLHEYHIYEARAAEADAVLLIARILDTNQLAEYREMATELHMVSLVEVHDEDDLKKTLDDHGEAAKGMLLGINNRDLETFTTDLKTTEQLMKKVPEGIPVVTESGISEREDIESLQEVGVSVFLIGEALLTARDIGAKLDSLLGK